MREHPVRAALLGTGGPDRARRRLLALVPGVVGIALLTACGSVQPAATPKSAAEAAQATPASAAASPAPASPAAASAASPAAASQEGAKPVANQWSSPPAMALDQNKKYTATIKTSLGDMAAELYSKDAPNTVNNFVFLANQHFYDGVIFHRIIKEFMVQTGDPTGTGRGGPGYKFNDELSGPQTYTKGTLAMANAGPNTQGSQFFICDGAGAERLPKNYTIFGKVTTGIETLDKIAGVQVKQGAGGENSSPVDPPKITSITIDAA
jgi:cyclophilin family peptidyl-prolyl cis-trans isomerase